VCDCDPKRGRRCLCLLPGTLEEGKVAVVLKGYNHVRMVNEHGESRQEAESRLVWVSAK
jgi:hypothetical protein